MRLESLVSLVLVGRIAAFTVVRQNCHQRHASARRPGLIILGVAIGTEDNVYAADLERELGIKDGQLALGIDPNDVLKYIGRREDLIEKTMRDIPNFSQAKAEEEVDKFLLDQDAIQMYINFGKAKEDNPDFEVPAPEEEGPFSFRKLVFGYLAYVVFTSIAPKAIRGWVAKQEEAGTWEGTGIKVVDDWIANVPAVAPAADAGAAAATSISAAATSEAVSSVKAAAAAAASVALPSPAETAQAASDAVASAVADAVQQAASASEAGSSLFDVASGVFQ